VIYSVADSSIMGYADLGCTRVDSPTTQLGSHHDDRRCMVNVSGGETIGTLGVAAVASLLLVNSTQLASSY
jgi:hypothetical protein